MKFTKPLLLVILLQFTFALTGKELAVLVDNRPSPGDMSSDMTMVITNKKGKVRTSTLRSITKDNNRKHMMWFLSPPDDKGVAYMKIEHTGKDDEIRLWLPAFKKIRRISSRKKSDAFMGSDLSYEDMTSRVIEDYTFKIIEDTILDSIPCYVLESTPSGIKSDYSKHLTWVEKSSFLPIKETSFDKSEQIKKLKTFTYIQLNSFQVLENIKIHNIQKNSHTELKFEHIKINTNIPEIQFHEKNLKRVPN